VSAAVVLGLAALLSGAAFLLGAWIGHAAAERELLGLEVRARVDRLAAPSLELARSGGVPLGELLAELERREARA
jgi:hypothetical protein